jgi:branched-chain amino acid transport system ATP-binding protein
MTVRDNLLMVPGAQSGEVLWKAWFLRNQVAAEEEKIIKKQTRF